MTPEPVAPALDGASVARVVPALLGAQPADLLPAPARDARAVVLLVLDGLGWNAITEHPDLLPTLAAFEGGPITTVVPSTTATALTSISTGLTPAQHGVMGYRMLVGKDVLNVLRWSVSDGRRPPDPFDVQRHTAFLGRDVPVVTRKEFRTSGFTQTIYRGARFVGWQTTATLVEHCARLVREPWNERLVYAYYPGVDAIAHEFGLHDGFYLRELAAADRLVADLLDVLPDDVALLVTSDHGQVHLEPDSWLTVDELGPLIETMAGDGRFRYLHAQRGAARELRKEAEQLFGDRTWVFSRGELLDTGWLGPHSKGTIPGRIGDVVLAAYVPVAFVDPSLASEAQLRSGHGSLTADEMTVPLVAALGRG